MTNLRKYNNIHYDDTKINDIKQYLQHNIIPQNFTKTKRENYNAFIVTLNGELQLKDTGQIVVPKDKKAREN
jgi:hypothetical protein